MYKVKLKFQHVLNRQHSTLTHYTICASKTKDRCHYLMHNIMCLILCSKMIFFFLFFFFFVALRLKSTAMVMAGWSVHLTTLFPGQA